MGMESQFGDGHAQPQPSRGSILLGRRVAVELRITDADDARMMRAMACNLNTGRTGHVAA